MPWLNSPLFLSIAVLGLVLFLALGAAGSWARSKPGSSHKDDPEAPSLLEAEVPWYVFAVVYIVTILGLLYILVYFVGY